MDGRGELVGSSRASTCPEERPASAVLELPLILTANWLTARRSLHLSSARVVSGGKRGFEGGEYPRIAAKKFHHFSPVLDVNFEPQPDDPNRVSRVSSSSLVEHIFPADFRTPSCSSSSRSRRSALRESASSPSCRARRFSSCFGLREENATEISPSRFGRDSPV